MLKRLIFCLLVLSNVPAAMATIAPQTAGVEVLPGHAGKHWFWVWGNGAPSQGDGRGMLFDDDGKQLATLSLGYWPGNLLPSSKHDEIFSLETYFSRGMRGERSDVITVYDAHTLQAKREIKVPAKRMTSVDVAGMAVLSDDERFLLVQNYTPAQSVSIVDLVQDKFVTEVETPGCVSLYAAGPRDFYSICGDGGFMHLRLDDSGQPSLRQRTTPVFDPIRDFITPEGARFNQQWYFVSGDNNVYGLEMTPQGVRRAALWSLLSPQERKDNWRISGYENTAIHRDSGRMYVLMHQGGPETRNEPGTEVWVYDIQKQQRIARIELKELSLSIGVSQGPAPRLYSVDVIFPMPSLAKLWLYLTKGQDGLMKTMQNGLAIYDAGSGALLHQVDGLPASYLSAILPW